MSEKKGYRLKRPCENCPFRTDRRFYLGHERSIEIAEGLRAGGEFHCHKTVNYDEEDGFVRTGEEEHCAGALIVLESSAEGPNQMMRIAERLGFYDPGKLDLDSPVYGDLDEFTDAMAGTP